MGLPAIDYTSKLQSKQCPVCFIIYAAPALLFERRQEKGGEWWCPNGHSLIFTETTAQKLQKEVDRLKGEVEWQRARAQTKEKELIAQKGLTTKAKKRLARIDNGVCPECNRTFANVARHMQTKHGVKCNQPPEGSKVRQ